MTATIDVTPILALSVQERIGLIQTILASISADTAAGEMDAEVREELDRRVAAYRANPSAAKPWDVVKASLRSRS